MLNNSNQETAIWRLINREKLLDMTMGDVEFLTEMIELFICHVPQQMNELKQAIEERDAQNLSHAVHACKGLIGNYTTLDPYLLTLSLEEDARADQLENSLTKYNSLEKALSQLIIELKMLVLQESRIVES